VKLNEGNRIERIKKGKKKISYKEEQRSRETVKIRKYEKNRTEEEEEMKEHI
jgi:hypothetical protein